MIAELSGGKPSPGTQVQMHLRKREAQHKMLDDLCRRNHLTLDQIEGADVDEVAAYLYKLTPIVDKKELPAVVIDYVTARRQKT